MKKIILILSTFTALLLASCASPAGSSNDDPAGTGTNTNEGGNTTGGTTGTKYTLSFNANYPFDDTVTYNNGDWVYASEFSLNGNTYYYEKVTVPEQTSVSASSYTLSASPYKYVKNVKTDNSYLTCETYVFSYYNTKADGTGTSYSAGQTIYLTQDTVLYCFYSQESNSNVDISTVHTYSLKVGESITFNNYYNDTIELYIDVNLSTFDSSIVDVKNMTVTGKAPGQTIVTALAFNENDKNKIPHTLQCLITVSSDDFSGQGIEYKLLGTWKTSGGDYNGTIIFNSDKTGSIFTTLNGKTTHNTTFNWSASESGSGSQKTYIFTITNANDNLNGSHGIYDLRSNRFSLNEWLSFGMPQYTTWYKQ